jgi:hypothetical protein
MIASTKYGLQFIDLYFNEQVPSTDADVIHYRYWSEPVADSIVTSDLNVVIDLRRDPAALLAAMAKSTRYDIRRAEREGKFCFRAYAGDTLPLTDYVRFFNAFADAKGIERANQRVLTTLAGSKLLALTCTCEADGSELIWHAYIRTGTRARLLHSASLRVHVTESGQGQFLARANRYHHWRDALLFRQSGVPVLDLAGICENSCESSALQGIRRFKTGFGGDIVRLFDCAKAVSKLGRSALWLKYQFLAGAYSRWRPAAEMMRGSWGRFHDATHGWAHGSTKSIDQCEEGRHVRVLSENGYLRRLLDRSMPEGVPMGQRPEGPVRRHFER